MKQKKNFLKNPTILILNLCFVLISPLALANEAIFQLPSIERNSAIEYESRILQEVNDIYHIEVRYPQIMTETINQADREEVNRIIRHFVDELSKKEAQFFTGEGMELKSDESDPKSEMNVRFKIIRLDERFVSIKFEYYFYVSGAAHGMSMTSVFNYDIENRRSLELKDLFEEHSYYLEQISAKAIEDLKRQLVSTNDDPEVAAETVRWIEDGASPTEDNLFNFSWNGSFLTIYFQPYQVACGAAGAREVSIFLDDLTFLRSEYRA